MKDGVVEDAPSQVDSSVCIHYLLLHHAVVQSDKDTMKIMIVYDASAKQDGKPSLNDCLLIGPTFNQ